MKPLVVLLLIGPLPAAGADPHGSCALMGGVALGIVTIGSGQAGSTTFYVDDRNELFGNGLWIYEESNHIDGLQRGGGSILNPYDRAAGLPEDNEICWDDSTNGPDALIF